MKQQFRQRFRWLTVAQVLALVATIAMTLGILLATDYIAVPVVLAIVVIAQVLVLIHSVHSLSLIHI